MLFDDIIGQEAIKERLTENIGSGRIPHAQLFCGNAGTGKLALALAFVRYLFCQQRREHDACGVCPSCLKMNQLIHPDLHFAFPIVKNKKKEICDDYLPEWREMISKSPYFTCDQWLDFIGAENSQGIIYAKEGNEIFRKLSLKSQEADYKCMIIWLPEKMHEVCANKLLKLIEEPYDKTLFLMVSDNPDEILPTIQSRTQRVQIKPLPAYIIKEQLQQNFHIEEENAESISRIANGNYIKACEMVSLSDENEKFLSLFISAMRNSWKRDVAEMKRWSEQLAATGREKQKSFLTYCQNYIRENYIYNLHTPDLNFMTKGEENFSVAFSKFVNEKNIELFMEEFEKAERDISQNVNAKMVFFDLSLKIAVLLKK
ncbi:MAG: DNA polymerase III subunit delta' [Bacteroidales bacterium]|nr:DNA polymerase III subunit delta' [Bacteroidales bacterium]